MTHHDVGDLLIHETRINCDRGDMFMDERFPIADTIFCDGLTAGELYREGVKTYGRCAGKVYVDTQSRGTIHCGYVFVKREHYEDTGEPFLCETWVTIERVEEDARPTVVSSVALS